MKHKISCCRECKDRYENCHSKCEKYQEERRLFEEEKELIRKNKKNLIDTFDRFKYWR